MTTATQNIQISPINMDARRKLEIKPGDTVRVTSRIQEKGKTRLQAFEGLVIAVKHGKEAGGTFTVRKVTSNVGVEKIFALYSPLVEKIEIIKRSKTRRAKLYYIREKTARQIRRKMKGISGDLMSTVGFEQEDREAQAAAEKQAEEEQKAAKEAEADAPEEEKNEEQTEAAEEPKKEASEEGEGEAKEEAQEEPAETTEETTEEKK